MKDVQLGILKDRDELSDDKRTAFLAADITGRMLNRREIENYLFDKEVLKSFCAISGAVFDEARYDRAVTDIGSQDLKPVQQEVMAACGFRGALPEFKRALAVAITPGLAVHTELTASIFP